MQQPDRERKLPPEVGRRIRGLFALLGLSLLGLLALLMMVILLRLARRRLVPQSSSRPTTRSSGQTRPPHAGPLPPRVVPDDPLGPRDGEESAPL